MVVKRAAIVVCNRCVPLSFLQPLYAIVVFTAPLLCSHHSPLASAPTSLQVHCRFLCAIHPSLREAWAAAWAKYLAPGGVLVTLQFPIELDPSTAGPPWPLSKQLYEDLLLPVGKISDRAGLCQ